MINKLNGFIFFGPHNAHEGCRKMVVTSCLSLETMVVVWVEETGWNQNLGRNEVKLSFCVIGRIVYLPFLGHFPVNFYLQNVGANRKCFSYVWLREDYRRTSYGRQKCLAEVHNTQRKSATSHVPTKAYVCISLLCSQTCPLKFTIKLC